MCVYGHESATQCFQHFQLYLKGREELLVTVLSGGSSGEAGNGPVFKAMRPKYALRVCSVCVYTRRLYFPPLTSCTHPATPPFALPNAAPPIRCLPPVPPLVSEWTPTPMSPCFSWVATPSTTGRTCGCVCMRCSCACTVIDPQSGVHISMWHAQLRSAARNMSVDDLDAPLDLPSTRHWMDQGVGWLRRSGTT